MVIFLAFVTHHFLISLNNIHILSYETLKRRQPDTSYFRTWGCLAYVRIPDPKRLKLASRAYECVFVGYGIDSTTYRFFDLNARVIVESVDADFYEDKFPFKLRNSGGASTSITPRLKEKEHTEDLEVEPRRSKRARVAKDFGPDFYAYNLEEDPTSFKEAMSSLDVDLWQEKVLPDKSQPPAKITISPTLADPNRHLG